LGYNLGRSFAFMRLSALQKYILKRCYLEGKKLNRAKLVEFYSKSDKSTKKEDQVNIITKSIERLISKSLLVGYGEKTAEKLFIREVRLTREGRSLVRDLMGKQQKLRI